jgi:hypothetical protein
MATNIVDALQKNLGYPVLHKVDPNIQETKDKPAQSQHERLAQAAIPAVLTALYSLSRSEEGCTKIISRNPESDWLAVIFKGHEQEAVAKVAEYSGAGENEAEGHMENIADEAIKILREAAGKEPKAEKVKTYMNGQRHNILVHLPAAMQMGHILNDDSLDDRTNKMEGPVSSFMHKIENNFSGGEKPSGIF